MNEQLGPILRGVNTVRDTVRDAGNQLRQGRDPMERLTRAMALLNALSGSLSRIVNGVDAPSPTFGVDPPAIIGPVVPEGGESRRLHLLHHPEDVPVDETKVDAAKAEFQAAVEAEVARILERFAAPMATVQARPATAAEQFAYHLREQELAREPEPVISVPAGFSEDALEELLGDDDLLAQIGNVGQGVSVTHVVDWVRPEGAGPEYVPPGRIPPGPPPPAPGTAATFVPFEGTEAQLTRQETEAIEADVAAARGRRQEPIPAVWPGLVTENPEEFEREVARSNAEAAARARTPRPEPAPSPSFAGAEPEAAQVTAPPVAPRDPTDPTIRCPECPDREPFGGWMGLQGHASALHGFKGNREALKEWARSGGSASSAA